LVFLIDKDGSNPLIKQCRGGGHPGRCAGLIEKTKSFGASYGKSTLANRLRKQGSWTEEFA